MAAIFVGSLVGPAALAAPTSVGVRTGMPTFHDPVYGFSFSYPSSWKLIPERDGSHVTLENPKTVSTISPVVTTVTTSPADTLKQAVPAGAASVRQLKVAGVQAVAYTMPFTPGPLLSGDQHRTQTQETAVVAPVANTSGSTNVYRFFLVQGTDAEGKISAASQADASALDSVLNSFALPSQIAPVKAKSSSSATGQMVVGGGGGCDAVCWADSNVWFTDWQNDSNGQYCWSPATNYASCANGQQTPQTNNYYSQPSYQCSEYVARALTNNGQIPGLINGGPGGLSGTWTSNGGNYTYGTYEFTGARGTPYTYNGDTTYALTSVGHYYNNGNGTCTFYAGLFHYLTDTYLGSAQAPNTLGSVQPGDAVFFYTSSSNSNGQTGQSDWTREHVAIVTSTDGTEGGTLLDAHNVAEYHYSLSYLKGGFAYGYQVVHVHSTAYGYSAWGQPTLYGGTWNAFTDGYGQSADWATTTTQSNGTAWAEYMMPYASQPTCAVAVYVPNDHATTNITYGIELTNSSWVYRTVNQYNIDGWAILYRWGDLSTPPNMIYVNNQDGTTTHQLGVGNMAYMC